MVRVAVFGAAGRMGATVCAAVADADDLELVGAVDPASAGRLLGDVAAESGARLVGAASYIEVAAHPEDLASGVEVAVDFTEAGAARENLAWCAAKGVHAVCGTTGFDATDQVRLQEAFAASPANCLLAPNFSIGAVLMMRASELCAPYFSGVEVIELHHDRKKDAPSGTSLETVRRLAAARAALPETERPWSADPTEVTTLEGTRGGLTPEGVRLHSVRLPGLVAHQEVIFGSLGETLTIRHDSVDRVSFMPGVLLAVRKVAALDGFRVGLESLLGL